jgi:FtsP/CotA-like multicopper oxidase with cupredoxin domain
VDDSVDRRTFLASAVVVAGVSMLSSSASAATGSGQPPQSAAPNFGLTKFLDPLRIPPAIQSYSRRNRDELTITMTNARKRLHSQLPETTLWTYEGHFPGPTIEVRSGRRLRVAWNNDLRDTVPLVAVQVPFVRQPSPANTPGYRNPDGSLPDGVKLIDGVASLPPWNVVHLHGALTNGGNDGWAHNAMVPGNAQLTEYPNRQAATALWYHDHAMAVTRFNVYAGLMGMHHCHILEHEDMGMMRPFIVHPPEVARFHMHPGGSGHGGH